MSKPSTDYGKWALYAVIAAFALLVVVFIRQKQLDRQRVTAFRQNAALKSSRASQKSLKQNPGRPAPPVYQKGHQAKPQLNHQPSPTEIFQNQLKQTSLKSISDFSRLAHLKLNLPMEMQFRPYELEEDMAVIHGHDSSSGTDLTAMAYPKDVPPEDAIAYLKGELTHIPNAKDTGLKAMAPPQKLPPPSPESGLKEATMWSGQLQNGNEIHVVHLRRSDSQGNYMFVYSGPPQFFSGNDGVFDQVYDQIRALPMK